MRPGSSRSSTSGPACPPRATCTRSLKGSTRSFAWSTWTRIRSCWLAYGRALLGTDDNTTVITADLRDPDAIFEHPEVRRLIDPSEPFAVLLGGVMMHLEYAEDPEGIAARIRALFPSGGIWCTRVAATPVTLLTPCSSEVSAKSPDLNRSGSPRAPARPRRPRPVGPPARRSRSA
ncbi:MAG: SAM-dependent methyltransferase [Pseudonocardia sp.]